MNAEHINPFIQGSQRVINSVCGERPGLGKIFLKKPPFKSQPVAVAISIIGQLNGTMVYTVETILGCYLASRMIGRPVTALDYMSQSALCELANIIAGNAATVFSEKGILVDITPPQFYGNDYPNLPSSAVCIPLVFQGGGVFEVDVCMF
ncbi:MAG: chemotaxis protein CheX [Defluviitaleaceae bacterium]|nr:chemotaxis protein CheX [Defluviitaleaceae bacterium]